MRLLLFFILHATVVASGVWDVVAVARGRPEDTISRTVLEWSMAFPILPFAIGVLMGHLFWSQPVVLHGVPATR